MGTAGVAQGFQRTALTGAAAALFVLALVVGASPAVRATPAQVDEGEAVGFASSRSSVVSLAPKAGNLAFAITMGTAIAESSGQLAQGASGPLDLGLIGTSLTSEGCDGRDPAFAPEDLPQTVQADNRAGPADIERTYAPIVGSDIGAGVSRVVATMQPLSRAATTAVGIALPPVIRVSGGQAVAETQILDDGTREGRATAEITIEIGDIVRLAGLQWVAVHRSGGPTGETFAEGTFEGGTLSLLGLPLPLTGPEVSIDVVNALLGELGFRIEMPIVERVEEPVDLIRVTPLRILVEDTPLGELAVKPALDLTRELRSALFDALTAALCSTADMLLVAEIGLGALSGTGSVVAEVGGVEARSGEVVYEDLLGGSGPTPAAPAGPPPPAAPAPAAASGAGSPVVGERAAVPEQPAAAPVQRIAVPATRRCESTHAFGWPPCSTGAALPVGLAGAAATAGVAALDLRRRRAALAPVVTLGPGPA